MFILRSLNKLNTITIKQTNNAHFVITLREIRSLSRSKVQLPPLSAQVDAGEDTNDNGNSRHSSGKEKQLQIKSPVNSKSITLPPISGEANVPTFNLAAYVNKSHTLQQFLKLGVNLHAIERRKGLAEFVLRLNFDENVKPYLLFLQDQGVSPELYGKFITKNPLLFKVDLDDLETRVNYLEAKKFTTIQRQRIFSTNPYWLMFSTRRIDRRLGHFQKEFDLSGEDVRLLATKQPQLITYKMDHIRESTFCIREEMGFEKEELRCLLLSKPRLWMINADYLIERFSYAHNEMGLSHDMLLKFPEVLTSREFRLRERHEFLKMLGRAQYNPTNDMYISPRTIVEGNNFQFARNVAKSDLKTFELFLKTR